MRLYLLLLLTIFVLIGCATPQIISKEALGYNISIEESNNKMLLLNIIRSMKRHPMHFSRISESLNNCDDS